MAPNIHRKDYKSPVGASFWRAFFSLTKKKGEKKPNKKTGRETLVASLAENCGRAKGSATKVPYQLTHVLKVLN